jgi:hypothetical protein
VLEECDESYFWIEFIKDENIIKENLVLDILKEAEELTKIFAATRKKTNASKE